MVMLCVCIAASHDSYGLDDDDVGDDAMPTRADDTAAGVIDTPSAAAAAGVDLDSVGAVDVPTGVGEFMRAGCTS